MLTTFANIRILEREELSRHVTQCWQTFLKMVIMEDFPGGLVVKTPCYQCRGTGLIPGQGSSTCLKGCGKKEKKKIVIMERVWMWKSERPGVQTQAVPTSAVKWALTPCWACVGTGSTATSRGHRRVKRQKRLSRAVSALGTLLLLPGTLQTLSSSSEVCASSFSSDSSPSGKPDCFPTS